MTRPHLLDALRDQVLLCDGGMGSRVQMLDLDVERDYWDRENCTEVLNLSRPELVREIHRGYFAAGADMVETNSFGGSPITLDEFDLGDRTLEINRIAGELAREAADSFSDGRHRYVVGSIGPGTKLPSLGNIAYDPLEAALAEQCRGLLEGGVDAILIETCQDTLQIKAAVNGAKLARARGWQGHTDLRAGDGRDHRDVAGGPGHRCGGDGDPCVGRAADRAELCHRSAGDGGACALAGANWPGLISVQPNAGLPELVDGQTRITRWVRRRWRAGSSALSPRTG